VTVFAETVVPALSALAARGALQWHARAYEPRDARGVRVVVLAPRDEALARQLRVQARRDGFLFSAIDQPAHCDFVWTSVVEAGRLQLSMSSGGAMPALLKRLRVELERLFDARFAAFTERVALARDRLTAPTLEARRAEMAALLDGFALEARLVYPSWEAAAHGEEPRAAVDKTP
jgi:precorrin-2 dehydrogenase/sirohydrochlorin ferrochelatase